MSRLLLGFTCGIVFGIVDMLVMLPLTFPDKRTALTGAFVNCLAIGVLTCVTTLPLPAWLAGVVVGVLVTLPSAVVIKTYVPIIPVAAIGGAIIGIVNARFGR